MKYPIGTKFRRPNGWWTITKYSNGIYIMTGPYSSEADGKDIDDAIRGGYITEVKLP